MTTTQLPVHIEPGAILFDMNNRRYYDLDALAALVWWLVQRPISFAEIRDAVVEAFGLEPEAAEHELIRLLEDMESNGLIEAAG